MRDWGLKQNLDAEDLGIAVAKREKRKHEENKETMIIARGEQLAMERLDLFQRRAKNKQSPSAGMHHHLTHRGRFMSLTAVSNPTEHRILHSCQ